MLVQRQVDE